MWPLADVSDLKAAFYFPNDARVNPTDVTQALAKGARQGGARILGESALAELHEPCDE
jgi:4-methylaminobutanoate oxidase (formaldehyde-forming)